jgi:hypothetical protein
MFQFAEYSIQELDRCGIEFTEHFATASFPSTDAWTKAVHAWFSLTIRESGRFYFNPRHGESGYHEFIVDLCHTTYPPMLSNESRLQYYERCLDQPLQIDLALECEWGTTGKADLCTAEFLDDATKLAHLRSRTKVMIFCSHLKKAGHRQQVVSMLTKLRDATGDESPWLWIDVPWEGNQTITRRRISHGLISTAP